MSKIKDLSATYKRIPTAEKELEIPLGTIQMGQRIGGVAMYSNVFKRGYGNTTFAVGDEGMWLGSADFDTAPIKIQRDEPQFLLYDVDEAKDKALFGKQTGGF